MRIWNRQPTEKATAAARRAWHYWRWSGPRSGDFALLFGPMWDQKRDAPCGSPCMKWPP